MSRARAVICRTCILLISVSLLASTALAQMIQNLRGATQTLQKENLGGNVNSAYSELLPVISADGDFLYFVRDGHPGNMPSQFESNQDIWFCERLPDGSWSEAKNIGQPLNTEYSDGILALSPDGNTGLFYGQYGENGDKDFGVSLAHKTIDGWSYPGALEIKSLYNLNRYSSACLSNDGKTLLLSVEMSDGYGDLDIYASFLQSDHSWSKPVNLGPVVNTIDQDVTPFLASDGVTLYFSSNGHGGFGHNDMFVSKRLDSTWTKWSTPQNLGPSINTSRWDAYYSIPASGEWAYFVSYEDAGFGESDIYRILLPDSLRPKPVVLVQGRVLDPEGKPLDVTISYKRLGGDKILGEARSNPATGEYSVTFPFEEWSGQQDTIWYAFNFSKSGYLRVDKNLDLRKSEKKYHKIDLDIILYPIPGAASDAPQFEQPEFELENVFFDVNEFTLRPESFEQLNYLADSVLSVYPFLEIIIAGHTDNTGSYDHNMRLSRNRAETVSRYLWNRGIKKSRITTEWYGYTRPIDGNATEEGRQKNRRVTFQLVSTFAEK